MSEDKDSVLIINGFDFEPYLALGGIKYVKNDVDSDAAGEVADGTFRRDRVIIRPTMEITLKDIDYDDEAAHQIMKALEPQWLTVTYDELRRDKEKRRETAEFYTNNITWTLRINLKGKRKYRFAPFTLVAKGIAGDGREGIA